MAAYHCPHLTPERMMADGVRAELGQGRVLFLCPECFDNLNDQPEELTRLFAKVGGALQSLELGQVRLILSNRSALIEE